MLRKARYFSDNPFRQLSVPSSTPARTLSKLAQSEAKKRQVGIESAAPLDALFGGANDETPSIVARISSDPKDRILYRCFWPLSEEGIASLVGRADSDIPQARFLLSWLRFLENSLPPDLESALATWSELWSEPFIEELAQLEVDDDRIELPAAHARVSAAIPIATESILTQAIEIARDPWSRNLPEASTRILAVILASPLDDVAESRALSPFIDLGDDIALEIDEWDYEGLEKAPIEPANRLRMLCNVIGTRHPAVDRWWNLLGAHELQAPPPMTMEEFIQATVPDLEPVDRQPDHQMTLFYLGAHVYRTGTLDYPRSLHWGIQFITFFFFPILPVGRYLLHYRGDRRYVLGKAKWTKWMKVHLLSIVLGIPALILVSVLSSSRYEPLIVSNEPIYNKPDFYEERVELTEYIKKNP